MIWIAAVNLNMLGGVKCFQSERISRHPLQFPHLTHQNFSFISVVDRFGRIFLSVFHDKVIVPSPHTRASHWLHVSVSSRSQIRTVCSILSANGTTFAAWLPKKMYRISVCCGLVLCLVGDAVLFQCSERAFHCIRPHTLASSFRTTRSFSFFFSPLHSNSLSQSHISHSVSCRAGLETLSADGGFPNRERLKSRHFYNITMRNAFWRPGGLRSVIF